MARVIVRGPPLYRAARRGYFDEVRSLLRQGADVNEKCGEDDETPLHIAAF